MAPDPLPLPADPGAPTSDDGAYYPVSDDMGESGLQNFISRLLLTLLVDYFEAQGRQVLVGSNQFFYFRRGDPRSVVAPDLYLIDDEAEPQRAVASWKVWEHAGKVPSLALEIVSDEYRKDYADRLIDRYQQLGVRELVRYDPGHEGRASRSLLTHFVRDDHGRLLPRPTPHDRVRCVSHDLWLVPQPDASLRIGLGPGGSSLWPTPSEKIAAAAADAARLAAETEVQRLRSELARLRCPSGQAEDLP